MAGPLRGVGKGQAIKEKRTFFILLLFENKDILLKTTYQNINTGNVGKVIVFYQAKNMALLVQKFWGGKKLSKFWLF